MSERSSPQQPAGHDPTSDRRAAVLGQLLDARDQRISELEAENERLRKALEAVGVDS